MLSQSERGFCKMQEANARNSCSCAKILQSHCPAKRAPRLGDFLSALTEHRLAGGLASLLLLTIPQYAQQIKPVCVSCHPSEAESYLASAMAKSIGSPQAVPAGKVSDPQSGSLIHAEWRKSKMFHRLSEDGMLAEYEIRYQIGAGKVGHSYATRVGDFLLESPASYYRRYGWDISPGYAGTELLDFNRVLTDRCLFCHSNSRSFPQGRHLQEEELVAIGCERCHGDTRAHVKHPSAKNIINPAKLPVRARDSVCEQCHLEGVARVLNAGKSLSDFSPGTDLEDTLAIYVVPQAGDGVQAVSQEEQLARSRCARESVGKLWCGTCHDPHSRATNRDAEIKATCTSCHPTLSPASHPNLSQCVSCHMPRRSPTDVAHAALTDHRILARPDATPRLALSTPPQIRAWHEPPPDLQQRDLALAYLEASARPGFQHLGDLAENLLKSLPPSQQNGDAAVLAALGDISLSRADAADALAFFHRACELEPSWGEYAMYLGISLKQNADPAGAVRELRRAIQLDPSLERSYLELSALYAKEGRLSEANDVIADYLKWNPQSILFRITKEALASGKR
jgi:Cytochrome c554 and c-prime